jgi:hypothetical protein
VVLSIGDVVVATEVVEVEVGFDEVGFDEVGFDEVGVVVVALVIVVVPSAKLDGNVVVANVGDTVVVISGTVVDPMFVLTDSLPFGEKDVGTVVVGSAVTIAGALVVVPESISSVVDVD